LALGAGGVIWGIGQNNSQPNSATSTGTPSAADKDLREQVDFLSSQLTTLREENASLVNTISELQQQLTGQPEQPVAEAEITPQSIASQVASYRSYPDPSSLKFQSLPRAGLGDKITTDVFAGTTAAGRTARLHALATIGFVLDPKFETDPTFVMDEALPGLRINQEPYFFDTTNRTLLYPDNLPLGNPDERLRLVEGISRALQRDIPGASPANFQPILDNTDREVARLALGIGDAAQIKIRYGLLDQATGNSPPPSPESQQQFYGAPVHLRELAYFPYYAGSRFVEQLHQHGGWGAVDSAYARPPVSSAEVLHPDLYLAEPPFAPLAIKLDTTPVDGRTPLHDDTAGEYGTALLLKTLTEPKKSDIAAAGWHGDRYIAYPGRAYFWKTVWTTPADASEFFMQMRQFLLKHHELAYDESYIGDRTFTVARADLGVHVRLRYADEKTVLVTSAGQPGFADALDSLHAAP
ncbi:MAG: hypothetical protein P8J87_21200, partial [Verrucomicrobiales bacterium]|nr:hypothetical protein [Verrucomicrobiales bacterium]